MRSYRSLRNDFFNYFMILDMLNDVKINTNNSATLCHFTIIVLIEQAKYTMLLQCSTGQNSSGECSDKL